MNFVLAWRETINGVRPIRAGSRGLRGAIGICYRSSISCCNSRADSDRLRCSSCIPYVACE